MRGGERRAVAAEFGCFSELGACVVFGVVWVTNCPSKGCEDASRSGGAPVSEGNGLPQAVLLPLFISRKSSELQMDQQICQLVCTVQSECIGKGKSPHLGEILRVISPWLDPDLNRTAEKGKKQPSNVLMLQQVTAQRVCCSAVPYMGTKLNALLVEDSHAGNTVSCSDQCLEALLSFLIAAWGFSHWLTGRKPQRCLKQKKYRTKTPKCCVGVIEMASQNLIPSFCERYKLVEHQI